jgi:hypothetical protein
MTDSPAPAPTPTPPRRSSGVRVAAIVTGSVLALVSLGLLAVGGTALWANAQKDDQGYVSTHTERFHTPTAALRTENLDIDLDGAETVLDQGRYGQVRLRVQPRADKDVFVGIARTSDVDEYLRGTAHATVTDLDYAPFDADYSASAGARRAASPLSQGIWAASAHGAGAQTLNWDVDEGDWSIVVMNEDGTPGVDAGVKAGVDVPFLDDIGWGAAGGGVVMLILASALLVAGLRTPRPPRPDAQASGPLPATA